MTKEQTTGFSYRIMQASPTELIIILYEMLEVYLSDAISYCKEGKIQEFRTSLKSSQGVLNELNHSLDMQYEISLNFMQIYMFINRTIIKVSVSKDTTDLERCIGMINKLRDAFEQVKGEDRRGPVMKNTQQVYAGLTYGKGTLNESFGLESNRGFRV